MLTSTGQIRIIQAGAELFAFDTIRWPGEIFQYPIVYTACAMNAGSYDAQRIGWKWIKREQFEWLVRHFGCLVAYVGAEDSGGHTFYCNNHCCWEKNGQNFSALTPEVVEPPEVNEIDLDEEREV